MSEHLRLAVQKTGPSRTEQLLGREFRVFPAVLVREQVLSNNLGRTFLPGDEIARSAESWNGIPVVIRHPTRRGRPVSARTPEVMNATGVGFLFRAKWDAENRALKADVFLDADRLPQVEGATDAVNAVDAGTATEVSTGFATNLERSQGTFDGEAFDAILRDVAPDHLALLPDEIGACSVSDGCGLGVNHVGPCQSDGASEPEVPAPPEIEPERIANDSRWKRLLLAAARLFGFSPAENQSDEDRRYQISQGLRAAFAGDGRDVWIDSVFSDSAEVVFEVIVREGESADATGLFRASYAIAEDGSVTFGEPARVRRVTTFEPAANAGPGDSTPDMGETMNRDQMIAHLVEAGRNREALNALTDCDLKALMGAAGGESANNAGGDSAAWRVAHQYRRELEELKAQTANAVAAEEGERTRLLDDILYVQHRAWSDEEVREMDIVQLRKVHRTMFPEERSYAGRGGPRATGNGGGGSFDFVRPIISSNERSVLRREAN